MVKLMYRVGYGLAALFWFMLSLNAFFNSTPITTSGNANRDTGAQVGGWLFTGFIVYATVHCLWKAIQGPRVGTARDAIDAAPQSSELDHALPAAEAPPDESTIRQPRDDIDRDSDIIRYVLENDREAPSDRIYFLTLTPRDQWGDSGAWDDVPSALLEAMPSIATEYRTAHEACLKENCVIDKATGKEAWMKWVSIINWQSETEVEVEQGVWCRPSSGGASTATYENRGGIWTFKSLKRSWVS